MKILNYPVFRCTVCRINFTWIKVASIFYRYNSYAEPTRINILWSQLNQNCFHRVVCVKQHYVKRVQPEFNANLRLNVSIRTVNPNNNNIDPRFSQVLKICDWFKNVHLYYSFKAYLLYLCVIYYNIFLHKYGNDYKSSYSKK